MVAILTLALVFVLGSQNSNAGQVPEPGKRSVWIYFYRSEDADSADGPSSQRAARESVLTLVPVRRRVSAVTPARGALEAIIAGPTEVEKSIGLRAPYTEGLSITRLTIDDGTARVEMVSTCTACPRWAGDLSVWRFKEAITRTLKQFTSVRRVVVCLDGYLDFEEPVDRRNKKCD